MIHKGAPMKKNKILIIVSLLLALGIGAFFLFRNNNAPVEETEQPEEKRQVQNINTKAIKERPYLSLTPSANGGEIFLSLNNYQAQMAEYEIEYQAANDAGGTIIQGGIGRIDLSKASNPTEPKEFCFCSQSKGVKKYDTGVSAGSYFIHFSGGVEEYSLKGDFTIGKYADEDSVFTSRNSKAILEIPQNEVSANTPIIVADPLGLPGNIDKEIVEGPYAFFAPSGTEINEANLTMRTKEDTTNLQLYAWNNQTEEWEKLEFDTEDTTITAEVEMLTTYILVR